MSKTIRIGTRGSELALWQANFIRSLLSDQNAESEIVIIKSEGEINLKSPLYEMGIQGIFTKALDIALLNNEIDIAVHSLKDVPTKLAAGLQIAAIPERGDFKDILVSKEKLDLIGNGKNKKIATSSLRRKAQWLHRFPQDNVIPIRGNINSRLKKLLHNDEIDAVLFAAAGIDRIALQVPFKTDLDWMIPAPSQGALVVICRQNDTGLLSICENLNDHKTKTEVSAERQFLNVLNAGCTMPVACLARLIDKKLHLKANILSEDGITKFESEMILDPIDFNNAGKLIVDDLLKKGADEVVRGFDPE